MYLLIQALNNINASIKILSFPFLARPPESIPYAGVQSHPGFHTTKTMETAALYALGRVANQNTIELDDGTHAVTDYPVVVGLDMQQYEKELDYDAEKIVKDGVEDTLREIVSDLPDEYTDEDIYESLDNFASAGDSYSGEPMYNKSPIDLFSEEQFSYMFNPISSIINLEDPIGVVREFISTGTISKANLMEITDQYRYLNDVPHTQILKVWYVTPVAEDATDAVNDDEGIDDILEKWTGFTVLDYDDVYSGTLQPEFTEVWARDDLEAIPVEYHGTTYLRLLQAVPEFASQLPAPPSPPYSP